MRAARWYAARDVRVEDVPVPVPGPGEVLVRVERAGICGTDLEEYLDGPVAIPPGAAPLTLGHELVGTVVGTTERVIPDVVLGCGRCWWCARHEETLCPDLVVPGLQADGGLAEYLVVPAHTCVPVPAHVELDVAAFAEPVSVAVRALAKAGNLVGTVVAILGAGVIGQLVAQVALAGGAVAVVAVDPVADRRALAERWGARACAPAAALATVGSCSDGRGADVVVECSGVPGALATSVELSRPGGTIVLVGFHADTEPVPLLPVVLGERRLLGTAAHLWDRDVASAVALLARGTVDVAPLLSAVVPLADVVAGGFDRLRTDRTTFKILIDPQGATR